MHECVLAIVLGKPVCTYQCKRPCARWPTRTRVQGPLASATPAPDTPPPHGGRRGVGRNGGLVGLEPPRPRGGHANFGISPRLGHPTRCGGSAQVAQRGDIRLYGGTGSLEIEQDDIPV